MTTQPHHARKDVERKLPVDTNAALRELIKTISDLQNVYAEENEALAAHNPKKFMDIQDKKLVVARTYHSDIGQMIARKNEIKAADPALRQQLKIMQENFSVISKENLAALDRMNRTADRLGNTIRDAVIREVQSTQTYSYGDTGQIYGSRSGRGVSTGLSETV